MRIEYEIVPHQGDFAVQINGVVYDDAAKFKEDFPLHVHHNTVFVSEMEFSWHEIYDDIATYWKNTG